MKNLVVIKPGYLWVLEELLGLAKEHQFTLIASKEMTLTTDQIRILYRDQLEKSHYPQIVEYLTSGSVIALVFVGENAESKIKQIKGKTWSGIGIRGKYATDYIRNVMHSSDALDFDIESAVFFSQDDL